MKMGATGPMMDRILESARAAGRDPSELELIILAFPTILPQSPGETRSNFVGTLDEVRRDVEAARDLGANEIIFAAGYATAT